MMAIVYPLPNRTLCIVFFIIGVFQDPFEDPHTTLAESPMVTGQCLKVSPHCPAPAPGKGQLVSIAGGGREGTATLTRD